MGQKKLRTIFVFGLSLTAIVLLAAGLSQLELLPGRPFLWDESQATVTSRVGSLAQGVQISDFWKTVIAIGFWVLFPLSILYLVISSEARKRVLRDIVWLAGMLLMLYLIVRALHPFLLFAPAEGEAQASQPPLSPGEMQKLAELLTHPPLWLTFAISAVLIALLLGVIWYLWQRFLRPPESTLELLAQEAQGALRDLRSGRDLKDTVMRCYHEMNRILSEHRGLRRRRAMTPREFEQHLERAGLHSEHIRKLTRLFEEVRYGAKKPGEREEREAVRCLQAIAQAYGGSS